MKNQFNNQQPWLYSGLHTPFRVTLTLDTVSMIPIALRQHTGVDSCSEALLKTQGYSVIAREATRALMKVWLSLQRKKNPDGLMFVWRMFFDLGRAARLKVLRVSSVHTRNKMKRIKQKIDDRLIYFKRQCVNFMNKHSDWIDQFDKFTQWKKCL